MLPTRKRSPMVGVLWGVEGVLQARYVLLSLSGHRIVSGPNQLHRQRLIDVFLRFTEPSEAWRLGDYIWFAPYDRVPSSHTHTHPCSVFGAVSSSRCGTSVALCSVTLTLALVWLVCGHVLRPWPCIKGMLHPDAYWEDAYCATVRMMCLHISQCIPSQLTAFAWQVSLPNPFPGKHYMHNCSYHIMPQGT